MILRITGHVIQRTSGVHKMASKEIEGKRQVAGATFPQRDFWLVSSDSHLVTRQKSKRTRKGARDESFGLSLCPEVGVAFWQTSGLIKRRTHPITRKIIPFQDGLIVRNELFFDASPFKKT